MNLFNKKQTNTKAIIVSLLLLSLNNSYAKKPSTNQTAKNNIIYFSNKQLAKPDSLTLPIPFDEKIEILLPALYRGSEPSEFKHMLAEKWYDFFYEAKTDSWYYKIAKIQIQKEYDECLGENTTAVRSKRKSTLLIKGIDTKTEHIPSINVKKTHIWSQENYVFELNQKKYSLRAEGTTMERNEVRINDEGDTIPWNTVINYRLYLSEKGNEDNEQLLIAQSKFEDTFVSIVFIGDLDGDGKPDFIFDTSPNYEAARSILFLSSKAQNGEIVRAVGESAYNFDC